jgi:phage shock protein C
MEEKKLTRSTTEKWVAGVCGGMAKYFDMDPILVRVIFALLGFWGPGLLVYIIMWIVVPEDTAEAPTAEEPAEEPADE